MYGVGDIFSADWLIDWLMIYYLLLFLDMCQMNNIMAEVNAVVCTIKMVFLRDYTTHSVLPSKEKKH